MICTLQLNLQVDVGQKLHEVGEDVKGLLRLQAAKASEGSRPRSALRFNSSDKPLQRLGAGTYGPTDGVTMSASI